MSRHLWGVVLTAISAVAFGFIPILARSAYAGGVDLVTLLLTRFALGAVVFWGYLLVRRLPWRLSRRDTLWLLGMGFFGYALQSASYYSSVRYIPAGLAALLLYVYPVLVTVLAWWVRKVPVTRRTLLALVTASLGVMLVLGASGQGFHPLGVLLALAAATIYSLYIISGDTVAARVDAMVMATYIATGATAAYAVAALFGPGLSLHLRPEAWAAVIANTVVATVIAMPTFFAGVALIGPSGASIVSTLEPLVTIAASALLLGEGLASVQWLGAALVLGSSLLIATARRRG